MKKSVIILLVIGLLVLIAFGSLRGWYNTMVNLDENVSKSWSQVENVYKRRADLIPSLVATVKGYAAHERETLEGVIEARSKATSVNIDPSKLDASSIQQFNEAQSGLSSALSRLMVVVERYPDLKANQNFLEFQSQLEGTENRITVERQKFIDSVEAYNKYVRLFPQNLIAKMFNFERKDYFAADAADADAPQFEF